MKPRERILTALDHREPDRVPIDLGAHRSSGISAIAYARLREHLGLQPRPPRVYDMVQQLAVIDEDVLDLFEVDTIEMGRGFLLNDEDWKPWVLPDGRDCEVPYYTNLERKGDDWLLYDDAGHAVGILKKGSLYFEQNHFPMLEQGIENDDFSELEDNIGQTIWAAIAHPGGHLELDGEGMKEMAARAGALRTSTDRAIVGLFGGNMFEIPQFIYRMDHYLLATGMYPDKVMELSGRLCEVHLKNLEKWLSAVGPYIDIILFGDDLGGQQGPLVSPEAYRRYYKPFHRKLWHRAKELADVKVQLHCCGGVYELLPDLIEAGLDAINPVQISSRGMEPERLKKEFGGQLTFWGGGCDTQHVLPGAGPDEVRAHVRRNTDILRPGGGFVFQQVHNILANVPPENIVAMLEAVND